MSHHADKSKHSNKKPDSSNSRLIASLVHQLSAEESELKTLLHHIQKMLKHDPAKPLDQAEANESQSWLDWGLHLLKEAGPLLAKLGPELAALL